MVPLVLQQRQPYNVRSVECVELQLAVVCFTAGECSGCRQRAAAATTAG
jgi:hypothetical protein